MRGLRCGPPPYWLVCGASLAAPWALGVLLLTAQAAEEATGPCVLAALALAAASALLAGLTI
ncbi:Protein of unknown function [Gryllus bimaculatus]|nr:Protein of unknown function [Gryllus bimaculatus]